MLDLGFTALTSKLQLTRKQTKYNIKILLYTKNLMLVIVIKQTKHSKGVLEGHGVQRKLFSYRVTHNGCSLLSCPGQIKYF